MAHEKSQAWEALQAAAHRRVRDARDARRRELLDRPVRVGDEQWKRLGEMNYDDLMSAAALLRREAGQLRAEADHLRAEADHLSGETTP